MSSVWNNTKEQAVPLIDKDSAELMIDDVELATLVKKNYVDKPNKKGYFTKLYFYGLYSYLKLKMDYKDNLVLRGCLSYIDKQNIKANSFVKELDKYIKGIKKKNLNEFILMHDLIFNKLLVEKQGYSVVIYGLNNIANTIEKTTTETLDLIKKGKLRVEKYNLDNDVFYSVRQDKLNLYFTTIGKTILKARDLKLLYREVIKDIDISTFSDKSSCKNNVNSNVIQQDCIYELENKTDDSNVEKREINGKTKQNTVKVTIIKDSDLDFTKLTIGLNNICKGLAISESLLFKYKENNEINIFEVTKDSLTEYAMYTRDLLKFKYSLDKSKNKAKYIVYGITGLLSEFDITFDEFNIIKDKSLFLELNYDSHLNLYSACISDIKNNVTGIKQKLVELFLSSIIELDTINGVVNLNLYNIALLMGVSINNVVELTIADDLPSTIIYNNLNDVYSIKLLDIDNTACKLQGKNIDDFEPTVYSNALMDFVENSTLFKNKEILCSTIEQDSSNEEKVDQVEQEVGVEDFIESEKIDSTSNTLYDALLKDIVEKNLKELDFSNSVIYLNFSEEEFFEVFPRLKELQLENGNYRIADLDKYKVKYLFRTDVCKKLNITEGRYACLCGVQALVPSKIVNFNKDCKAVFYTENYINSIKNTIHRDGSTYYDIDDMVSYLRVEINVLLDLLENKLHLKPDYEESYLPNNTKIPIVAKWYSEQTLKLIKGCLLTNKLQLDYKQLPNPKRDKTTGYKMKRIEGMLKCSQITESYGMPFEVYKKATYGNYMKPDYIYETNMEGNVSRTKFFYPKTVEDFIIYYDEYDLSNKWGFKWRREHSKSYKTNEDEFSKLLENAGNSC